MKQRLPGEMLPQLRYRRSMAFALVAAGVVNLFLGGWLLLLGTFHVALVLGLLILLTGILYLTRPYGIIESDRIILPALIGPLKREYPYQGANGIKLENGSLYVRYGGEWRSVPVSRWLCHPDDWHTLEERYEQAAD